MKVVTTVVTIICTAAFAIAVVAIILVSNQKRADINDSLHRQHDICVAINKLYSAQRADALDNYAHLDRNLKLLHIKKTPRLVKVARDTRDAKLKRFADQPC